MGYWLQGYSTEFWLEDGHEERRKICVSLLRLGADAEILNMNTSIYERIEEVTPE